MVQEFPAPRLVPQVFDWEKGPLVVMLVMLKSVLPKSLNVGWFGVTVHAQEHRPRGQLKWQEMDRDAGDRVAFGPETTPVPVKATDSGLPTPLSVMVIEAFRGPI